VDKLQPDLVFLTGDYIEWNGDAGAALDFFLRLHAKTGIWAVMGDADYSRKRTSCVFCHEDGQAAPTRRHSIRFLKNASDSIPLAGETISLFGIDGVELNDFNGARLKNDGRCMIILSHSPLLFDKIEDGQNVLILSGDTHGGQVPLPALLNKTPGYEKMKYSQGLFIKGMKKMYVSRGIGTSDVPLRLLRTPEVVVLHFRPEQSFLSGNINE